MDFIRYAEAAAALVNAQLDDRDALVTHLAERQWLCDQCTEADARQLREFQEQLRPVFEASDEGAAKEVVAGLNELMAGHPITPMISDLGNVLCAVVTNAGIPNPTVLCQLLKALIPATPTIDQALPPIPGIVGPTPATSTNTPAPTTPTTVDGVPVGGAKLVEQIQKLLAGAP